jgi:hypothetical protein
MAATSSASAATPDVTDFKADLCQYIQLVPVATCKAQIQVDIQPFGNFTNVAPLNPISGQTFSSGGLCYGSGTPGEVVLMRVYYLWPLLTPFLLGGLENVTTYSNTTGAPSTGRWAAVSATEVFVNEPNSNFTGSGVNC